MHMCLFGAKNTFNYRLGRRGLGPDERNSVTSALACGTILQENYVCL